MIILTFWKQRESTGFPRREKRDFKRLSIRRWGVGWEYSDFTSRKVWLRWVGYHRTVRSCHCVNLDVFQYSHPRGTDPLMWCWGMRSIPGLIGHRTDLPALPGLIRYLYSPSPTPAVVTHNPRALGSCCKPSKWLFKVELILHLLAMKNSSPTSSIIVSFLLTLGREELKP